MNRAQTAKLKQIFGRAKTILLTTHRNPDGDGIGSGLALMSCLLRSGKKVDFINRDAVPGIYNFLEMSKKIRRAREVKKHYDLVVFLECPDFERCGSIIDPEKYAAYSLNIDHHLGNEMYADYNIVDPKAPAVGMQLFNFMKMAKWGIDKNAAEGLYTAIITDTGSFAYSNTTPEVHLAAAELLKAGARPVRISSQVYSTTEESTSLLSAMLSNVRVERSVGYSYISMKMFEKTKASDSETDNFINSIRAIRNVDVAVLFKEYGPAIVKVSFRSKTGVDVNKIANALSGGGHKYAAGCVVRKPLKEAMRLVLGKVHKSIKKSRGKSRLK